MLETTRRPFCCTPAVARSSGLIDAARRAGATVQPIKSRFGAQTRVRLPGGYEVTFMGRLGGREAIRQALDQQRNALCDVFAGFGNGSNPCSVPA
jgi:hypothetical protein